MKFSVERSSTLIWHLQENLTKSILHVSGSVNWKMTKRLTLTQLPFWSIQFFQSIHNQSQQPMIVIPNARTSSMTRNQLAQKMENFEPQILVRHFIFAQMVFDSQILSVHMVFSSTELIVIGQAKLIVHLLKQTHSRKVFQMGYTRVRIFSAKSIRKRFVMWWHIQETGI